MPLTPSPPLPIPQPFRPEPRGPRVAEKLPYFPAQRARQLDVSRASVDTIKADGPPPLYLDDDDDAIFRLAEDDLTDDASPLSEPEDPASASSLTNSTGSLDRLVTASAPPTARPSRRTPSLAPTTSGGAPIQPASFKSAPTSPLVTTSVAVGRSGDLLLAPAADLEVLASPDEPAVALSFPRRASLPLASSSSRARGLSETLGSFFGLASPAPPPRVPVRTSSRPLLRSPRLSPPPTEPEGPAYVSKLEVAFCPTSPSGRTCRQLIIKLRRLSDPTAAAGTAVLAKAPNVVTRMLQPADDAQTRVRVTYSNGLVRDVDPSIGCASILAEIERSLQSFSL